MRKNFSFWITQKFKIGYETLTKMGNTKKQGKNLVDWKQEYQSK
jgi:hypothetical protein